MMSFLSAWNVALPARLQSTSLEVATGQMVALIGPNGGGKTSLLRALADIEGDTGVLRIGGEDVRAAATARRAKLLSFLPASRDIVWPIRGREVIALSASAIHADRVDELVSLLDLGPIAERPINMLSTGERARILLARALASRPHLLLLDEPLSNLDPYWVLRIVEILRAYVDRGASAVVALHQLEQLHNFDRILLVDQGRVIADGAPDVVLASRQVADSFNVEWHEGRWRIRPSADPRSSP